MVSFRFVFVVRREQEQSFATNHMEDGVHIGKGTIVHLPEDYVVPLFKEGDTAFWRRESLILPKVRVCASDHLVRPRQHDPPPPPSLSSPFLSHTQEIEVGASK